MRLQQDVGRNLHRDSIHHLVAVDSLFAYNTQCVCVLFMLFRTFVAMTTQSSRVGILLAGTDPDCILIRGIEPCFCLKIPGEFLIGSVASSFRKS